MTTDSGSAVARTFLIADIRGYTTYTAERGDAAAAELANRFAELAREVIEAHEGFLIELRGDEALAAFVSARNALRAALAMQIRFKEAQLPRGVGIGLDSGEAIPVDGGFRGTALNLAARLCAQAKPGQVIASEAVIHLAARLDGVAYVEPRTLRLKGLDEPVRAVDVVPTSESAGRRLAGSSNRRVNRRVAAVGGVGGLVALVVVAALVSGMLGNFGQPTAPPTGSQPVANASPTGSAGSSSTPAGSASPGITTAPSTGPFAYADLPVLAFLDPTTGAVTHSQPAVAALTDQSIFADGDFWVLGLNPVAVYRIDPTTHQVKGAASSPVADGAWWTVANGTVWVSDRAKPRVVAVDVATGAVVHDFALGTDASDDAAASGVAVGAGSVWVSRPRAGELLRINPTTGTVEKRLKIDNVDILWFGNGALWATGNGYMSRIDPETNEATFSTQLANGDFLPYMTFSPDAAWTADDVDGTVFKVNRSGRIDGRYQAGVGARALQYMDGTVWVGAQDAGEVDAIDANTGRVTAYKLGHEVSTVAAGAGQVMVGMNPSPDEIIGALEGKVLHIAMRNEFLQGPAPDPATNPYAYNRMLLYATCSRLLDYGDAAGPDSFSLRPEVAAAMPDVSADGLTYTFTIKPGFGFSPPSTEQITAETYRYSIERSLSPGLGEDGTAIQSLDDIEGATAFHDGLADHVTGLRVQDDKLIVTLTTPSATFLQRLMLPFSCPVPLGTPAVPSLDPFTPLPNSGPYYLFAHGGGEYAIIKRNPNYGGARQGNYDAITFKFGLDTGETVRWVDDGRADVAISDEVLQAGQDLADRWGPDSDAAAQGHQRWYGITYPGVDVLIVNPKSSLLNNADARRAVALALDRNAAAQGFYEIPATSLLDDAFEVRDPAVQELLGPDPTGAASLLSGRTGTVRFVAFKGCQQCLDIAQTIKSNLVAAGITMEIIEDQNPIDFANDPKNKVDMLGNYAQPFFPDAASLLEQIGGITPPRWITDDQASRMQGILAMSGAARDQAAASFAHDLTADGLLIPYGYPVDGVYFGDSIGCRTIINGIMNLDLVALCPASP